MKNYFVTLDGELTEDLTDSVLMPIEAELKRAIVRLDGSKRFATMVGSLPEGVDIYTAKREHFFPDSWIQVGGSAERLLVQLARDEGGRDIRLYNVSFEATAASAPLTDRVDHGPGHTMVRPAEIMTWEQALPILVHYVRHDQTIPKGLHLRDFGKPESASFSS